MSSTNHKAKRANMPLGPRIMMTLEIIEESAPFVDLFKLGRINYHRLTKVIDLSCSIGSTKSTTLRKTCKNICLQDIPIS